MGSLLHVRSVHVSFHGHMGDDQAVPALISGAPLYWQFQSQAAENFMVPPGEEWSHYCRKFQDTMPSATIIQITRIQNRIIGKDN